MITRFAFVVGAAAVATIAAAGSADAQGIGVGHCYYRIDGGYGWSADSKATARVVPAFGAALGSVGNANLDHSWLGEIGLGCHLVHRVETGGSIKDAPAIAIAPTPFRGDITLSYLGERRFNGVPSTGVGAFVEARLRSQVLMFNGYYDLPKMHGITPYVGIGIGVAFQELHRTTFSQPGLLNTSLTSSDEASFAWSVMTGLAINLGANVMFDLGYRYLGLDSVSAAATSGFSLTVANPSEHQLKIGLRVPLGNYID